METESVSEYRETYSHESLENMPNHNFLLALYYRSEYGGMKCDIKMLKDAIHYYSNSDHNKIKKTEYGKIQYDKIEPRMDILLEAVDFHPFPQMLSILAKKTKLEKETIKIFIWNANSGYNARKPNTVEQSSHYMSLPEWKIIDLYLDDVRTDMINTPIPHYPLHRILVSPVQK
jgi:hypothetical protein